MPLGKTSCCVNSTTCFPEAPSPWSVIFPAEAKHSTDFFVKVYEDAQNKYAAIRKSISAVIEEAYDVLYKSSRAVTAASPIKEAGKLFALNTMWQYPRQAVVEIPIDTHPGLKTAAAQISKSGQKGIVLLDATDMSQPMIAHPKGLYADVPRVTGTSPSFLERPARESIAIFKGCER